MNFKAAMVGSGSTSLDGSSSGTSSEEVSYPLPAVSVYENSLQITIRKLNRKNYFEWSQFVRLVIDEKGKLRYLNGEVTPPAINDPKYRQWRLENSMVTAWLINSMDPIIEKTFMYLNTTCDV